MSIGGSLCLSCSQNTLKNRDKSTGDVFRLPRERFSTNDFENWRDMTVLFRGIAPKRR